MTTININDLIVTAIVTTTNDEQEAAGILELLKEDLHLLLEVVEEATIEEYIINYCAKFGITPEEFLLHKAKDALRYYTRKLKRIRDQDDHKSKMAALQKPIKATAAAVKTVASKAIKNNPRKGYCGFTDGLVKAIETLTGIAPRSVDREIVVNSIAAIALLNQITNINYGYVYVAGVKLGATSELSCQWVRDAGDVVLKGEKRIAFFQRPSWGHFGLYMD